MFNLKVLWKFTYNVRNGGEGVVFRTCDFGRLWKQTKIYDCSLVPCPLEWSVSRNGGGERRRHFMHYMHWWMESHDFSHFFSAHAQVRQRAEARRRGLEQSDDDIDLKLKVRESTRAYRLLVLFCLSISLSVCLSSFTQWLVRVSPAPLRWAPHGEVSLHCWKITSTLPHFLRNPSSPRASF